MKKIWKEKTVFHAVEIRQGVVIRHRKPVPHLTTRVMTEEAVRFVKTARQFVKNIPIETCIRRMHSLGWAHS